MDSLQLFMDRFKAGVFDILAHSMSGESSIRLWYRQLSALLKEQFEVEETFYFYKKGEHLYEYSESLQQQEKFGQDIVYEASTKPYYILEHDEASLKRGDILIPCYEKSDLMGFIAIRPLPEAQWAKDPVMVTVLACDTSVLYQNVRRMLITATERKRYHELFDVTKAFNSHMNVSQVLAKIIHSLENTFPFYAFTLILTDEQGVEKGLPIEYLDYQSDNEALLHAFVSSEVTIDDQRATTIMYSPLKGKQGVYGLLKTEGTTNKSLKKHEIEFIKVLSTTAGHALENAKLYMQSRQLINDLKLINDLSHELNANLNMKDMMSYLADQIKKALNPDETGFIWVESNDWRIVEGSSAFFSTEEGRIYIENVKQQLLEGTDGVYMSDCELEAGYHSLIAVPMIHHDQLKGFCIVLHRDSYAFTFEMYKLFKSIVHHSALALVNAMLRVEMQEMINHDHMTGLYARHYLDQYVEESMEKDEKGVFILIDIDDFKKVNDTFGHQKGDQVIIQLAKHLNSFNRDHSVCARWGGEELAMYFSNMPLHEGVALTEELRKTVQHATDPEITISCGVSNWNRKKPDLMINLVRRADVALYQAKNAGKNQVVCLKGDADKILH
ncbi:sensor domain-containing diguanylate cyclase [Jeotgalibacillus haloalkalitolerans]|uniref:GGDEF domain-containing protein n=1 Tax=Jeotgalibacillus haloalkalitolerans TaxID=3104292 RepID=A0ABU5KMM3_9BACL|nr:GGDEF domain-containing protein [Jeotgalibacillus sp. HH7-29]MDZ5712489.1 GGDEF domain-containing protein [Jeotgalibacillus sp. HH7-29]